MADLRKSTGSRTPAPKSPTKPGLKYPTPDPAHDFLIIENKEVDSREQPIAPATAHPSIAAAKLIDQSFTDEADNKKLRTRVYAAYGSPTQQDLYNFTLSYLANSLPHRVVTRAYVLPRAGYAALAKKTADTAFPEAKLTDETNHPIDGDKANWSVIRIYEELPGPVLSGSQIDSQQADAATAVVSQQTVWNDADIPTFDSKSLSFSRVPIDSLKSQQTFSYLPSESDFPPLSGQELDRQTGILTPYVSQIVPAGTAGTANSEITPLGKYQSRIRTFTPPTSALNTFIRALHGNTTISLPDVLKSVDVYWIASTGDGDYTDNPNGTDAEATTARNFNIAIHRRASAEASVSLIADINAVIERRGAVTVPCVDYLFYVPNGTSRAAILAKVSAAEWPAFRPVSHDFTLRGGKLSASRNVDAQVHLSVSNHEEAYGRATGRGSNHDVGPSIRTITLPPTIHEAIPTLGGDGATHTDVTATVDASADTQLGASVGFASPETISTDVFSPSVTPSSLGATTPSAIPHTGLYLIDLDSQLFRDGYTVCRARVINAANL